MKVFKRLLSILLTTSILIAMSTNVFGTTALITDVDITTAKIDGGTMDGWISKLLGMVQYLGVAVAMGMLFYVGIKYVTAAANEKADLKTASIRYVIGAIILFGLTGCFEIVKKIMGQLEPTP